VEAPRGTRAAGNRNHEETEMSETGAVVVVGGTRAIGLEIARHYERRRRDVVVTGRSAESVGAALADLGGSPRATGGAEDAGGVVTGSVFDLAQPETIRPALAGVGPVRHLVLAAIDRDANAVREYDIARATHLVMLKLVGYTEVIASLVDRMADDSSIVLFGGMAKERPYPGSTTVSTVNGGIVGLTRTLVEELRPIRTNSIHPGIVGDSPFWAAKPAALDGYRSMTPTGRLATIADIVSATAFLLENEAVNGVELIVDGGWHCR
jgi:NAD(P)-dependent dehydrogenase (short-subunit alcohol dehydrogenase family)